MLIDDLKTAMFAAMKAKDTITKEVLRTAIGEATATGDDTDDARVRDAVRSRFFAELMTYHMQAISSPARAGTSTSFRPR